MVWNRTDFIWARVGKILSHYLSFYAYKTFFQIILCHNLHEIRIWLSVSVLLEHLFGNGIHFAFKGSLQCVGLNFSHSRTLIWKISKRGVFWGILLNTYRLKRDWKLPWTLKRFSWNVWNLKPAPKECLYINSFICFGNVAISIIRTAFPGYVD